MTARSRVRAALCVLRGRAVVFGLHNFTLEWDQPFTTELLISNCHHANIRAPAGTRFATAEGVHTVPREGALHFDGNRTRRTP